MNLASIVDTAAVDVPCPKCGFWTEVTLKEVRIREAVICRGCKRVIQLEDHMNQIRKEETRLRKTLEGLGGAFEIRIDL